MSLATIDIVVIAVYVIAIFGLAQWMSRDKAGAGPKNATDHFLAPKNLPWWAIGPANAYYEWMAAITLLIVGNISCRSFSGTRSAPSRNSWSGGTAPVSGR